MSVCSEHLEDTDPNCPTCNRVAKGLTGLRWREVSGVRNPANEEPGFAVLKSADDDYIEWTVEHAYPGECGTPGCTAHGRLKQAHTEVEMSENKAAQVAAAIESIPDEAQREAVKGFLALVGQELVTERADRQVAKALGRVDLGGALERLSKGALGNEDVGRTPDNQFKDNYHEMLTGVIERLKAFKEWLRSTDPKNPKAGEFVQPMIVEFEKLRQESEAALSVSKAAGLVPEDSVFTPEGVDPEVDEQRREFRKNQAQVVGTTPRPKPDGGLGPSTPGTRPLPAVYKDSLRRLAEGEGEDLESAIRRDREEAPAQRGRVLKGS